MIAEHRLSWLRNLCDRVICMKDGQVAFDLSMQAFAQYSTEQLHQMGLRSLRDEKIAPVQNSVPETETMQLQNFCFSYDGTTGLNIPHYCACQSQWCGQVHLFPLPVRTGEEVQRAGQDKRTALEKQTAAEKLLHGHAGCEPPTVLRNSS